MKYETIQYLMDTDFKRLTGVQRETFEQMLKVAEKGLGNFGRLPKLSRGLNVCLLDQFELEGLTMTG